MYFIVIFCLTNRNHATDAICKMTAVIVSLFMILENKIVLNVVYEEVFINDNKLFT